MGTGEVQGQTRQHARLINLLGVKQIVIGVNKMDCDVAKYGEERYKEIKDEMVNMLWWKGMEVVRIDNDGKKSKLLIKTLLDCFEKMVVPPARKAELAVRMPVSGVFKIGGVGDVITGRVEQGAVRKETQMIFLPSHTPSNACQGKVFTFELHHKQI